MEGKQKRGLDQAPAPRKLHTHTHRAHTQSAHQFDKQNDPHSSRRRNAPFPLSILRRPKALKGLEVVVREGWLLKKRNLLPIWQMVWVKLTNESMSFHAGGDSSEAVHTSTSMFSPFANSSSPSDKEAEKSSLKLLNSLPMRKEIVVRIDKSVVGDGRYPFSVQFKGSKGRGDVLLRFSCETHQDRSEWINSLYQARLSCSIHNALRLQEKSLDTSENICILLADSTKATDGDPPIKLLQVSGALAAENAEHVAALQKKKAKLKSGSSVLRRLFGLPSSEILLGNYSCAAKRSILLQGRMFVSSRFVCFYSNIMGHVTKLILPMSDVSKVEMATVAIFFDNSIRITTKSFHSGSKSHFFASFLTRGQCYSLIRSLLPHDPSLSIPNKSSESHSVDLSSSGASFADSNTSHLMTELSQKESSSASFVSSRSQDQSLFKSVDLLSPPESPRNLAVDVLLPVASVGRFSQLFLSDNAPLGLKRMLGFSFAQSVSVGRWSQNENSKEGESELIGKEEGFVKGVGGGSKKISNFCQKRRQREACFYIPYSSSATTPQDAGRKVDDVSNRQDLDNFLKVTEVQPTLPSSLVPCAPHFTCCKWRVEEVDVTTGYAETDQEIKVGRTCAKFASDLPKLAGKQGEEVIEEAINMDNPKTEESCSSLFFPFCSPPYTDTCRLELAKQQLHRFPLWLPTGATPTAVPLNLSHTQVFALRNKLAAPAPHLSLVELEAFVERALADTALFNQIERAPEKTNGIHEDTNKGTQVKEDGKANEDFPPTKVTKHGAERVCVSDLGNMKDLGTSVYKRVENPVVATPVQLASMHLVVGSRACRLRIWFSIQSFSQRRQSLSSVKGKSGDNGLEAVFDLNRSQHACMVDRGRLDFQRAFERWLHLVSGFLFQNPSSVCPSVTLASLVKARPLVDPFQLAFVEKQKKEEDRIQRELEQTKKKNPNAASGVAEGIGAEKEGNMLVSIAAKVEKQGMFILRWLYGCRWTIWVSLLDVGSIIGWALALVWLIANLVLKKDEFPHTVIWAYHEGSTGSLLLGIVAAYAWWRTKTLINLWNLEFSLNEQRDRQLQHIKLVKALDSHRNENEVEDND